MPLAMDRRASGLFDANRPVMAFSLRPHAALGQALISPNCVLNPPPYLRVICLICATGIDDNRAKASACWGGVSYSRLPI